MGAGKHVHVKHGGIFIRAQVCRLQYDNLVKPCVSVAVTIEIRRPQFNVIDYDTNEGETERSAI